MLKSASKSHFLIIISSNTICRDGDRGSSGYRSRDGDGDSLPDSDHWATSTDNNWTDYDQEVAADYDYGDDGKY